MPIGKRRRGFAYLAVLAMVAAIAIMAFQLSGNWMAHLAREKERELLFNGDQIARAILRYYNSGPVKGCYPLNLADLLEDRRGFRHMRHLRKMYPDPITGTEWVLVKDLAGRITGVHSGSEKMPFKQQNFPTAYRSFNGKTRYSDWIFAAAQGTNSPASPAACSQ
jgi:type II secretory pathway pseudopilin PulG